ncbi:MAG: hypothetical protein AB1742_07205 [bacterium]
MKAKVDSDKIIRHIKYTKHWLEKANEDFTHKQFTHGSTILSLARAEITAALEEALLIKSRIASKLPRRVRGIQFRAASSVSLLAAGFLIAVLIIEFTSNPLPRITKEEPREAGVAVTEEAVPAGGGEGRVPAAAVSEGSETAAAGAVTAPAAPAAAAPVVVRMPRAAAGSPAGRAGETPAVPAGETSVEPAPEPEQSPRKVLHQSEIIDLYKTAKEALVE